MCTQQRRYRSTLRAEKATAAGACTPKPFSSICKNLSLSHLKQHQEPGYIFPHVYFKDTAHLTLGAVFPYKEPVQHVPMLPRNKLHFWVPPPSPPFDVIAVDTYIYVYVHFIHNNVTSPSSFFAAWKTPGRPSALLSWNVKALI